MFTYSRIRSAAIYVVALIGIAVPATSSATHSWGGYHWARTTTSQFWLNLGDNVSSIWEPYLNITSPEWSLSEVLDTTIVPGGTSPKRCQSTRGRVEVCATTYGNNGWLGLAQIWISGSHITQGITKLNDTYFNTTKYNTSAWRRLVMCQEIGHTLGLDHQDVNFSNTNLGTCMDYTNNPAGNEHPNKHDYDQLVAIYNHTDSTNTFTAATASNMPPAANDTERNRPAQLGTAQWGNLIRSTNNGRTESYELDLGGGHKVFTFVIWAEGED